MNEIITALMHPVSSGLQKVGIDIIGAIQQIDNLLVVLRHWREDAEKKFSELFDKSKKIVADFDFAMSRPQAARLSRYRSNICPDDPCEFYRIIRSTSKSRPNNIRGEKNVRPYVRTYPSVRPQKVFSISMKFGIQVEVDE